MSKAPAPESDQQETIAFLRGLEPCTQITTHASHVFLYGARVLKLKRALRYAYLDFSTPEKRIADCERELAINRRFSPGLYLGLRRITRNTHGALQLDGAGEAVDGVVEMRPKISRKSALSMNMLEGLKGKLRAERS
jgi:aminoglycoside phosphotransferase family enzyme